MNQNETEIKWTSSLYKLIAFPTDDRRLDWIEEVLVQTKMHYQETRWASLADSLMIESSNLWKLSTFSFPKDMALFQRIDKTIQTIGFSKQAKLLFEPIFIGIGQWILKIKNPTFDNSNFISEFPAIAESVFNIHPIEISSFQNFNTLSIKRVTDRWFEHIKEYYDYIHMTDSDKVVFEYLQFLSLSKSLNVSPDEKLLAMERLYLIFSTVQPSLSSSFIDFYTRYVIENAYQKTFFHLTRDLFRQSKDDFRLNLLYITGAIKARSIEELQNEYKESLNSSLSNIDNELFWVCLHSFQFDTVLIRQIHSLMFHRLPHQPKRQLIVSVLHRLFIMSESFAHIKPVFDVFCSLEFMKGQPIANEIEQEGQVEAELLLYYYLHYCQQAVHVKYHGDQVKQLLLWLKAHFRLSQAYKDASVLLYRSYVPVWLAHWNNDDRLTLLLKTMDVRSVRKVFRVLRKPLVSNLLYASNDKKKARVETLIPHLKIKRLRKLLDNLGVEYVVKQRRKGKA